MTTSSQQPLKSHSVSSEERYRGFVEYIYAFDIAYDMKEERIFTLLGRELTQFEMEPGRRNPRDAFFFRPQMVKLSPVERIGPRGAVRVERSIKLFPVGAISLTLRVPFDGLSLEELVYYHELSFQSGPLRDEARTLAEEVRRELEAHTIRPHDRARYEETYTVFCLDARASLIDGQTAEEWLRQHRVMVALLLTQERLPLSEQETEDTTSRYISYYERDIVVTDWNAALILDDPKHFDESLHIIELANVQLAELQAYDRLLDDSIRRSYTDVAARSVRRKNRMLASLREIRIDLTRLSDELSNTTKFFGDWHLARLYQQFAGRFHLADWHATIDSKLKTLDDLYQLLKQDQINRWMITLEVTIVLLFVIDVIIIALEWSR